MIRQVDYRKVILDDLSSAADFLHSYKCNSFPIADCISMKNRLNVNKTKTKIKTFYRLERFFLYFDWHGTPLNEEPSTISLKEYPKFFLSESLRDCTTNKEMSCAFEISDILSFPSAYNTKQFH